MFSTVFWIGAAYCLFVNNDGQNAFWLFLLAVLFTPKRKKNP